MRRPPGMMNEPKLVRLRMHRQTERFAIGVSSGVGTAYLAVHHSMTVWVG